MKPDFVSLQTNPGVFHSSSEIQLKPKVYYLIKIQVFLRGLGCTFYPPARLKAFTKIQKLCDIILMEGFLLHNK